MKDRRALITGVAGQDGSYLVEHLLEKGYEVHGLIRNKEAPHLWRISHLLDRINLIDGDVTDPDSMRQAIKASEPDEVYNLAAQSSVGKSWKDPELTNFVNGVGVLNILEALRRSDLNARFYQASTSEMFGNLTTGVQDEASPFSPQNPYAISKVFGHWTTVHYSKTYGMFNCSGIFFNHESPRRGLEYVSRKITDGVARIKLGKAKEIRLGNLQAQRDWGFAGDFVRAMWQMLQQPKSGTYVVSTGKLHSVEDFTREAFRKVGIEDWKKFVKIDPRFIRPNDVVSVSGDSTKAREVLGWKPEVSFSGLVEMMVQADIERIKKDDRST